MFLTTRQREVDGNLRVDLDRFAIEEVGFVPPLLHGFDGGLRQHRVATHQPEVLNGAVLADYGLQNHSTLDASCTRQRWIGRSYLVDQQTFRNALRHANALRRLHLRHRDRSAGADDAANHAAHRSARYAARNTTHHAGRRRRWRFVFLQDFNLFRNLGGLTQLPVVEFRFDLLDDSDRRCCSRRWRWGGRRWRS